MFPSVISVCQLIICVDSSKVDFTSPENFYHDVNSVAGLVKQFFRELPEPLFTSQLYAQFIDAARTLRTMCYFLTYETDTTFYRY